MDRITTFFISEEKTCMKQPSGFMVQDNKVYRLPKILRGLQQLGKEWTYSIRATKFG